MITNRLRPTLVWASYLASLWLIFRPALLTHVVADDFINPFGQAHNAGFSISSIIDYTVDNTWLAGHFNYSGQVVGGLATFVLTYLITDLSFHYVTTFAVLKFVVFLMTIEVATNTLVRIIESFGRKSSRWNARLMLMLTFGLVLQIHVPWSNDPVASYPLAGYGTLIVGLTYLSLGDRVHRSQFSATSVGALSMFSLFAVTYYEANVLMVFSVGLLLFHSSLDSEAGGNRRRKLTLSIVATAIPLLFTAFLYGVSQPQTANYTGTQISPSFQMVEHTFKGLLSSLPTASWGLAREWLASPMNYSWSVVRFLMLLCVLLAVTALLIRPRRDSSKTVRPNTKRGWVLLTSLLMYWGGTTLLQSSTVKVRDEALRVGQVYTYYAIGSVCVAILIATGISLLQKDFAHIAGIAFALLICVGVIQYVINTNVTMKFNERTAPVGNLLNVYADGRSAEDRCIALAWWKSMGWPEYYWVGTEVGMNATYKKYKGVAFCEEGTGR